MKNEITRAQKALRHAQKRGASDYIQGRIQAHIDQTQKIAKNNGGTYAPNETRRQRRNEYKKQEAARIAKRNAEAAKNRIHVVSKNKDADA